MADLTSEERKQINRLEIVRALLACPHCPAGTDAMLKEAEDIEKFVFTAKASECEAVKLKQLIEGLQSQIFDVRRQLQNLTCSVENMKDRLHDIGSSLDSKSKD